MGQTVYVDLLFMINFSMDFLCFFLCAKILGIKLSLPRAIAASAVGGVYSDVALFIGVGRLQALLIDIFVCVLMCAIVFCKRGRNLSLPLYILVYVAISMALGGFMTAIFNLLNKLELPLKAGSSDGISVWLFALLAAISAAITLVGGRFFRSRAAQRFADVDISYGGRSVRLRAMTDSGNLLREPISGKPCIVADVSALEKILPQRIVRAARKGDISAIGKLSAEDAKKVRVIPIRTAGGESALIAFRAESVTVDGGRGAESVDALVALSNIGKSAEGAQVLLPPELIL